MNHKVIMTSETYSSERGLISCIRDEEDEMYKVFAYAIEQGVTAEHFSDSSCREYWMATVLAEKEGDFGLIGTHQRLSKEFSSQYPHFYSDVLGAHEVVTFAKGAHAVDEVIKNYNFTKLQSIGDNLSIQVKDREKMDDPMDFALASEKQLQELIQPKSSTLMNSQELTKCTISEIRRSLKQGPARIEPHLPWLKFGLNGGFKDGHLNIVAARPSVGKTTIVLNFIYHAALQGRKTLFFSLEMKSESLWEKLGLIRSGAPEGLPYKTTNPETNQRNADRLIRNIEECQDLPIFIDDFAGANMGNIRATSRIMHRKHNLDCIVVDYVGLVKPEDGGQPREQQVAEISRMSKQLAKELNIPIFLICQLNRDSVKKGSEPQLHDLRESGQIEQDADVVLLLHRDLLGDKEDVKLIVAKNRFGGTGHSRDKIKFKPMCQRFIQEQNNALNDGKREVISKPANVQLYNEEIDRL